MPTAALLVPHKPRPTSASLGRPRDEGLLLFVSAALLIVVVVVVLLLLAHVSQPRRALQKWHRSLVLGVLEGLVQDLRRLGNGLRGDAAVDAFALAAAFLLEGNGFLGKFEKKNIYI